MIYPQPERFEIASDWDDTQAFRVRIHRANSARDTDSPAVLPPARDWLDDDWSGAFALAESPERETPETDAEGSPGLRPHDDPLLRLYLRDARREPVLTEEEERRAGWSAHFGEPGGRERLILGNLRLVVHLAHRYQGLGLAVADLVNEGNLGLMRAAERFDPLGGARFATYAAAWIRQRILRALDNQARTVRRPANYTQLRRRVLEAEARLEAASGRAPEDHEIAAACRLRVATVRSLRGEAGRELSLDAPCHPHGEGRLADCLPDAGAAPDEALAAGEDREQLAAALAALGPREQRILSLRYGLEDGQPRTLEETGRILGLLRQRVHQLETAALRQLRQRMVRG